MQRKSRFIQSIIQTASQTQVEMPWARGSRRISFSNARNALVVAPNLAMTA